MENSPQSEIADQLGAHRARKPVDERRDKVRLNGKPPVRRLHEVTGREPAHFAGEIELRTAVAQMFDQRVAEDGVEGAVGKCGTARVANHPGEIFAGFLARRADVEHGNLGQGQAFRSGEIPKEGAAAHIQHSSVRADAEEFVKQAQPAGPKTPHKRLVKLETHEYSLH